MKAKPSLFKAAGPKIIEEGSEISTTINRNKVVRPSRRANRMVIYPKSFNLCPVAE